MTLEDLQARCRDFMAAVEAAEAAHDISHVNRVVTNVVALTRAEDANPWITLPAAWLHDCVAVAKDSPWRAQGYKLAAKAAIDFLGSIDYPQQWLADVYQFITGG